jgi:mono/diheme cytochrome c family protein
MTRLALPGRSRSGRQHLRRIRHGALLAALALALAPAARAQTVNPAPGPAPPAPGPGVSTPDGKTLYRRFCAGCHDPGPGHPGTMRLTELHREHPPLIGRSELDPNYVRTVVHNGLIEMPPFRPTELSEDDITNIIAYITSPQAAADVGLPAPAASQGQAGKGQAAAPAPAGQAK